MINIGDNVLEWYSLTIDVVTDANAWKITGNRTNDSKKVYYGQIKLFEKCLFLFW